MKNEVLDLKRKYENLTQSADFSDPLVRLQYQALFGEYEWKKELLNYFQKTVSEIALQHEVNASTYDMQNFINSGVNLADPLNQLKYQELAKTHELKSELLRFVKWKNGTL